MIQHLGLIKQTNPLPAICGRVCVRPCELACRRNYLDEGAAVGIDYMKRFAADQDLMSSKKYKPEVEKSTGKKIAIISGLIYWAFPLIAAYTTQIHTEPLQVLCVILSYLFLFRFSPIPNAIIKKTASIMISILLKPFCII